MIDSLYIHEFIGSFILFFGVFWLGKASGHTILGAWLILYQGVMAKNAFNPAVATVKLFTKHITVKEYGIIIVVELVAAFVGYYLAQLAKQHFIPPS